MKHRLSRLVLAALALGACGLAQFGCTLRTPAYSTEERFARISRNIRLEQQMLNDDIDHVLLLRPATGLTYWNVP